MFNAFRSWLDNTQGGDRSASEHGDHIDWLRIAPYLLLHLGCLGVIWTGVSPVAVWVCLGAYLLRMFAITAFYHRHFAHKTFQTSPAMRVVFAALGATAAQRGPLWWAAHHRAHHVHADRPGDAHSPREGFWHAHVKWFLLKRHFVTDHARVPDLLHSPALRWIDRHDLYFPLLWAVLMYALGAALAELWPDSGTSGAQMLVWGFFISTVLSSHVTYCINSLGHAWGSQPYDTGDDSRNNALLAVLTLGEGWHNNHHCCPGSARQGFHWWQLDISYLLLRALQRLGLVWDLKQPNRRLLANKTRRQSA